MDKTEKLILCVQQHRCLYDIGDIAYKNITKKSLIWEHIAKELDDTSEGVKVKWKHIRDGYTKYKKLRNVTTTTGKKEKYQNWVWGPQLRFLDDCAQPRPRIKNLIPKKRKIKDEQQNSPTASASTSFQEHLLTPVLLESGLLNPEHMSLDALDKDPSHLHNKNDLDPFQEIDNRHLDKDSLDLENKNDSDTCPESVSNLEKDSSQNDEKKNDSSQSQETDSINVDKDSTTSQNKNDSDQIQDTNNSKSVPPVRRRRKNDTVNLLFTSYAQTFKSLNPQTQAALKINLAQLFYEAEIRELDGASGVQS